MDREKRKYPRRNIFVPMVCWELADGKAVNPNTRITVKDLSEGGVAFKSATLYTIGSELYAETYLPGRLKPLGLKLKVVSIKALAEKNLYLVGAEFIDIKPEDKQFIGSCLEGMNLYKILETADKIGASDVHLTVGRPPIFRVQSKIQRMQTGALEPGHIKAMLYPLLNESQIEYFQKNKDLDFAFSPTVDSRFRVNLHLQKGFPEAALRSIPSSSRSFRNLGLPEEAVARFCKEKSGLFLIAGKTGSGKTTTLTTMIDFINQNLEKVVITIEDPVEYIHSSQKSVIKQRELGSDTPSYADALKHTLRQDPDIIIVGELLDGESVLSAMRAAETGHLVISTIHSPDTIQTVERIVNLFPPEHSMSICQQLSSCLLGVLFQMLIPGKKGNLVLATELLVNNPAVRNVIREKRFSNIEAIIQTGGTYGMYTLESSLKKLYDSDLIDEKTKQIYSKPS